MDLINLPHLKNRKSESLCSRIHPLHWEPGQLPENGRVILSASSDLGVVINGGRRGTSFGPKAIINQLCKLQDHLEGSIFHGELADRDSEAKNFFGHQESIKAKIVQTLLKGPAPLVHLGGGHDHILPLLKALHQVEAHTQHQLAIINLDPHLDTRVDAIAHSGNPFRNFAQSCTETCRLWQIGTQDFANSSENYLGMEKLAMTSITMSTVIEEGFLAQAKWWKMLIEDLSTFCLRAPTTLVLSLDADSIESSSMQGVSAPGPMGFSLREILHMIEDLKTLPTDRKVFGIYEYNPLYDNVSGTGARALAQLMYQFLK